MSGAEGVNHREEGIPLTPAPAATAAAPTTTTMPAGKQVRRTGRPATGTAPAAADLGMAAEGERYSVDDDEDGADEATATAEHEGEPDDGIHDDDDDADAVRAAVMRKARLAAHRAAAASASRGLPMLPGSAQPAAAAKGGTRTRGPRRRELTSFAYWWLCCRVCMRWRVLKHVLVLLAVPTLLLLAGVYYFYFMPTSGLSFSSALVRGDTSTVRYWLDWGGASLDGALPADAQQRHPIHLAALGNHTDLVRLLLDRGAALDARDEQGLTPLHYAAHVGSFSMVQLLLERGADVESRDDNLRTPLHLAAIVGSVPVLALLVFEGQADLRASDADAYLATDYARLFHTGNLQKLLDDGYYYHPSDGRMRVISQGDFERVRERESRPWTAPPLRIEGGAGGTGSGSRSGSGSGAGEKEKSQSKRRKNRKPDAKASAEAKAKAEEERKQRKRQRRAASRGEATSAPPAPASQLAAAQSAPSAATSPSSVVDEDAELMALFIGDEDAHSADVARYKRSAEEEAQQREAAAEYSRMLQQGAVDQDEFDL